MIREFWVENFLSIRNRQTLNFETKSRDDEWASVDLGNGKRVNKLAVIYGPNASGKSNMLYAIQCVFEILFYTRSKRTDQVHARKAFALCQNSPTRMYVSFYANRIRYDYSISFNRDCIFEEKMDWYPNGAKSLFYERHFISEESQTDIKFGVSVGVSAKTKDVFLQNTLNNHSVLSVFEKIAFETDAKPIADLYLWMASYMHNVANSQNESLTRIMRTAEKDTRMKDFFLTMLKKADFNIVDFHTETKSVEVPIGAPISLDDGATIALGDEMVKMDKTKVSFTNEAGSTKFDLSLSEQSKGTQKFLTNLYLLYRALSENHIFLIDEIDSEIHDDLLLYYLNIFLMNSKESQLIFTSQETSLLNEDLLNTHRDCVFFAEKNHEGAYSEYTRADEYGLHKNLSLYKSYRNGRLGAIPQLGSPLLYFNEDEKA